MTEGWVVLSVFVSCVNGFRRVLEHAVRSGQGLVPISGGMDKPVNLFHGFTCIFLAFFGGGIDIPAPPSFLVRFFFGGGGLFGFIFHRKRSCLWPPRSISIRMTSFLRQRRLEKASMRRALQIITEEK